MLHCTAQLRPCFAVLGEVQLVTAKNLSQHNTQLPINPQLSPLTAAQPAETHQDSGGIARLKAIASTTGGAEVNCATQRHFGGRKRSAELFTSRHKGTILMQLKIKRRGVLLSLCQGVNEVVSPTLLLGALRLFVSGLRMCRPVSPGVGVCPAGGAVLVHPGEITLVIVTSYRN
jgi:hypothetical protein